VHRLGGRPHLLRRPRALPGDDRPRVADRPRRRPEEDDDTLLKIVSDLGPATAVETFAKPIREVTEAQNTAGLLLVVGLLGALWSASGYVSAFSRASNAIYEVEEGRPFWKLRPLQILVTLVCVLLLAVVALALVATGPLAESIGRLSASAAPSSRCGTGSSGRSSWRSSA
jgi:uncharacterized BrkB/YihY/UPF0761 family membrane protein